jgi:arylsulfatase A-like enzyme
VYVENHRVVGYEPADPIEVTYQAKVGDDPTGAEHPELLTLKTTPGLGHDNTIVNGISRIGYMSGGKAARWHDEDTADVLTQQALAFVKRNRDKPFFLYFATHDTHVPRVPHPRFRGATKMGARGDVIVEFDWSVGQVLDLLDELQLADDTIVILSSDNGPVVKDGYIDHAVELLGDHKPAGPLRGGKSTAFEGGTRVPFIVRWPKRVKPGISDALVCQIDLLASLAAFTGQTLPDGASPDGIDVMNALLGESKQGRKQLVEQSRSLALRSGKWKLIEPERRGVPPRGTSQATAPPKPQLYNLADDLSEQHNLAHQNPEMVAELSKALDEIRNSGRLP